MLPFLRPSLRDPSVVTASYDLFPTALLLLAQAERFGRPGLTTDELRDGLSRATEKSPKDLEKTPGDTLTRFDRAVQNLISHSNLTKNGHATFERLGNPLTGHGLLSITEKGKADLFDESMGMFTSDNWWEAGYVVAVDGPNTERNIAKVALMAHAVLEHFGTDPTPAVWLQTTKDMLTLRDDDLELLPSSSITRIDRTIRNLVSHNTLTKDALLERDPLGAQHITLKGKASILELLLPLLPAPDFGPLRTFKRAPSPAPVQPIPPAPPVASSRRAGRGP